MTLPSRTRAAMGRALAMAAVACLVMSATWAPAYGWRSAETPEPGQASSGANPQAVALQDFQMRLDRYLALRNSLAKKLKPLSPTADAAELAARQQSLAAALRTARLGAKPGDLVPKPVASQIAATIMADFRRRSGAAERATFSEVPNAPLPAVNKPYPADAALPTVPPLLLTNLPRLPDNLQYRFYGRHVVILDEDVEIIADYVANVLPPH